VPGVLIALSPSKSVQGLPEALEMRSRREYARDAIYRFSSPQDMHCTTPESALVYVISSIYKSKNTDLLLYNHPLLARLRGESLPNLPSHAHIALS
jgi:hypothetical protein